MVKIRRRARRGFGSIAAIAWMLILAVATAMAAAIAAGSAGSATLSGLATRAGLAAESGVEWGRLQAAHGACLPKATFAGALPGFPDMMVVVSCSRSSTMDGGQAVEAFHYSATACSSSDCPAATPPKLYAERSAASVFWR